MATEIHIVPSDQFLNNYADPEQKLNSTGSDISNWWGTHINVDNNHSANVTTHASDGVSTGILNETNRVERITEAENNLFNSNPVMMLQADAVIVLDYMGGPENIYGYRAGGSGTAGTSEDFLAIADAQYEDTGNLLEEAVLFGTQIVAFHELLHLYDADHNHASTIEGTSFFSWYSPIYSPTDDIVGCNDPAGGVFYNFPTSECTNSSVHSYYNINNL